MISDPVPSSSEREYVFDTFRFFPGQQLLLHHETPVRLGSRALDILAELVERAGELVSKRELMARAWPQSVVEESNLKVHVAALRRALCDGGRENRFVATVSGRGYRFVAPVTLKKREEAVPAIPPNWELAQKLPAPATRTTGRAETIASLLGIMGQRRIVSIVGPGGIGKSTLALPLAEAFIAQHGTEICFVDLSTLPSPKFVTCAVVSGMGLTIDADDGVISLIAALQERRVLLVLDSCERFIDAVAVLVDRLTGAAPGLQILATSREPLRTAGEYVYRLAPLAFPPPELHPDAAQALAYPAVKLFELRAAECLDGYRLSDEDAPAVAEICRRLEGIPLAIELAATRMDALGASELAARLGDRFQLLKRGRRSALERHRTLAAALDWSYDSLPESEQSLLRALSVFAGAFKLDTAIGLCSDERTDASAIVDGVANLVDKSLLSADVSGACVYYRLLDTTKAYALEKLDEHEETDAMRRRHAVFHRALFERASMEWDTISGADWQLRYARSLDDVRAALAWAFGAGDHAASGIALTVAAIPLWMQLFLLEEGRHCVERALASGADGQQLAEYDEMKLRAVLGAMTLYANGPVPATESLWSRVLALAEKLHNLEYQLIALWGQAVRCSYGGEVTGVHALAERFRAVAAQADSPTTAVSIDRLIGTALHYAGDQPAACDQLRQMLGRYVAPVRSSRLARYQLDQHSAALGAQAHVLWLRGFPQQAMETVQSALREARASGNAQSLLFVIVNSAFPVTVESGDYAGADALLSELSDCLKKHSMALWGVQLNCLRASLRAMRGDPAALPVLHQAVEQLQEAGYRPRLARLWATLAAALGAQGQREAGLALIGTALSCCEAGEELWCRPELLRIKGSLLEQDDAHAAEQLYLQALEIAAGQGALSWQLRVACSLARLKTRQGAAEEGLRRLREVYAQFTEGFESADLQQARKLLDREE